MSKGEYIEQYRLHPSAEEELWDTDAGRETYSLLTAQLADPKEFDAPTLIVGYFETQDALKGSE